MSKYSLILSPNTSTTTKIKVLELCKNGGSLFQNFIDKIENDGNLIDQLSGAIRIIEDTANLNRRPQTKFREIKDSKIKCKIYEAKSGSIRVYLFHEEKTGRVIVSGGLKGDQDEDIKAIKKVIKEYYESK
ncbi:MAG: SAM-dependent MidA family methyltransferase [Vicingaceae bacterium]